MTLSPRIALAVACVASYSLVLGLPAAAQQQSSASQRCINTMNKAGAKVAKTQGKENSKCVKDAGREKLVGITAEACLSADRKSKLAKATGKTVTLQSKKCVGVTPNFGFTGAATVNSAVVAEELALTTQVFGSPLDAAIKLKSADKAGAGCQAAVIKTYEKLAAAGIKAFLKCKKDGLKEGGGVTSAQALEDTCFNAMALDAAGKIAKAKAKLEKIISKKCASVSDMASTFPADCQSAAATGAAALTACLDSRVDCHNCLWLNAADGLDRDCDSFDDGSANGSCRDCGNGFVEAGETCDDAGESAVCDSDCTPASCGDGTVNTTAGETCDDSGESATCDSDCSDVQCGDGLLNVSAGEDCDDGGESAACNGDCTPAVCGDGKINTSAGETCDDSGESATCDSDCTAASCGDGVLNNSSGESCDDGNLIDGDGCDSNCTVTGCGNGVPTAGESCDDGNLVDGDGCDSNCTATACGNGVLTAGESCDDGNLVDGDGCDSNCTATACGNGVLTAGESCDDGNLVDGDGCDSNCTATACGNGVVTAGESCDDGNLVDGDGCDSNCTPTGCGNGIVTAGEDCDDSGESAACDSDCSLAACGDGTLNTTAGELCDDGGESAACDSDCTPSACGDGTLNPTAGEGCDDGNPIDGDGCDSNCTSTGCGNGIVTAGEACDDGGESATCDADCTQVSCGDGTLNSTAGEGCDDGNLVDGDGCDSNCTATACGNGVVTAGESCDDGNLVDGDGCDSNCTATGCGNGVLTAGEACDDGNLVDGDGCDSNCTPTGCGNGIVTAGEACDDGNLVDGDGCDSNCTATACGNGVVTAGESCDDGNLVDGDGCDSNCTATGCGNGIVTAGEDCDDSGESAACDSDCSLAACGDGTLNTTAGELCDDGGESAACDSDCTLSACGDGTLNATAGEGCDDGNLIDGDGCDSNCTSTGCGNGIVTAGEECDDGGESATCDADCTQASCGDGTLNTTAGEACDDGGQSATCDADCSAVQCGDGTLNTAAGEQCDDGNLVGGDCCSASCTTEPGCQHAQCPDRGELTLFAGIGRACSIDADCPVGSCDLVLGRCKTVTELDTGTTGISHDQDINDDVVTKGKLLCTGPPPCGECTVEGIDPEPGNCRCSNDTRQICDQPFQPDVACGGAVCDCYFGSPFPLSSGGIAACILNRFADDISGTGNVDTGSGVITANLKTKVFLGINNFIPCPTCVGDTTPGDGLRDGACVNGESDGLSCDANGENTTFPGTLEGKVCDGDLTTSCQVDSDCKWCSGNGVSPCNVDADCSDFNFCSGDGTTPCTVDADCDPPGPGGTCTPPGGTCIGPGGNCLLLAKVPPGGFYSLDCLPEVGANISGDGLQIGLTQTTGTSSLPTASLACGFPFFGSLCHCRQCSGDTTVPCSSNADCTGIGTCSSLGSGTNQGPNGCQTGSCVDIGGGEAECQGAGAPPPEQFCDGVVRGNGRGYLSCSNDSECLPSVTGVVGAGLCTQSLTRECFLPDITATGVADPNAPVGVATFCVPPTSSGGINGVVGLPGPGRVTNQATARTFCASDPNVEYQPGIGGCP